MTYWKFGGGYSYRTPGSKKTRWAKTLSGVPDSAKGSASSKPSKKTRKSGRSTTKVVKRRKTTQKKGGRRGSRLLGSLGIKGALIGGLTYFAVSSILPPVGGVYAPAITKVATGLTAKAVGVPGAIMAGAGLIEGAAIAIGQFLSGGFSLPFLGRGNGGNGSGYDY